MAQVLKEDIRERILGGALEEFYQNGFTGTTMRTIAKRAGVPAGLIYSYYENKEALFDQVLRPVCYDWGHVLTGGEGQHGDAFEGLSQAEEACLDSLLEHRKEFLILMTRSEKTKYEGEKEKMIREIEVHLNSHSGMYDQKDPVYLHIIASNFVDGLLQVASHYKSKEWAHMILERLTNMYLSGIGL